MRRLLAAFSVLAALALACINTPVEKALSQAALESQRAAQEQAKAVQSLADAQKEMAKALQSQAWANAFGQVITAVLLIVMLAAGSVIALVLIRLQRHKSLDIPALLTGHLRTRASLPGPVAIQPEQVHQEEPVEDELFSNWGGWGNAS